MQVVLVLGFSNIFADAFSMGMGEYLSSKAHNEFVLKEREREAWYVCMYGWMDVYAGGRREGGESVGRKEGLAGQPGRILNWATHTLSISHTCTYIHTQPLHRELENFREGEIREMIDIYIERGMDADDAEVRRMH